MAFGTRPPPSAPISPIIEPATAVASGQRSGTNWNSAPLPAPRAEKHSITSNVVAASDLPARAQATSVPAMVSNTTVRVLTPPQRSEIQPPKTRSAAPMKAASMVSWPACILLTENWS